MIAHTDVARFPVDVKNIFVHVLGGDELYGLHSLSDAPMAIDSERTTEEAIRAFNRCSGRNLSLEDIAHSAPAKALLALAATTKLFFACGETTHKQLAFVRVPRDRFLLKHKAVGVHGQRA